MLFSLFGNSHNRATLDTYAKRVRSQGQSQYAPIYPVMVELLKKGMKEYVQ